jgi:hemerythrin-like metal-binding protein
LIQWQPDFALGNEVLDAQHAEMLAMTNRVLEAYERADEPALIAAIQALVDHSAAHFMFEERLMAQTGYGKAAEHRDQHGMVLAHLHRFSERLLHDERRQASERVATFLQQWFASHVKSFDHELAKHLAARDVQDR